MRNAPKRKVVSLALLRYNYPYRLYRKKTMRYE